MGFVKEKNYTCIPFPKRIELGLLIVSILWKYCVYIVKYLAK